MAGCAIILPMNVKVSSLCRHCSTITAVANCYSLTIDSFPDYIYDFYYIVQYCEPQLEASSSLSLASAFAMMMTVYGPQASLLILFCIGKVTATVRQSNSIMDAGPQNHHDGLPQRMTCIGDK
jgi:hypothetical protein